MNKFDHSKVKVTGAPLYDAYLAFSREYDALQKKSSEAFDGYIAYLNPGKDKKKGPVSEGIAAVDKIDEARKNAQDYLAGYIRKNPSSYVAAVCFLKEA